MSPAALLENIVSASAFNKGQSARCFEKASDGLPVIVVKNNLPYRVVMTSDDYMRMSELEQDNALLQIALARLEANAGRPAIPAAEAYADLGIDMSQVDAMEDVELA